MMECVCEVLDSWPRLRTCLLFTGGAKEKEANEFYRQTLKVFPFKEIHPTLCLLGREKRNS